MYYITMVKPEFVHGNNNSCIISSQYLIYIFEDWETQSKRIRNSFETWKSLFCQKSQVAVQLQKKSPTWVSRLVDSTPHLCEYEWFYCRFPPWSSFQPQKWRWKTSITLVVSLVASIQFVYYEHLSYLASPDVFEKSVLQTSAEMYSSLILQKAIYFRIKIKMCTYLEILQRSISLCAFSYNA